MINVVIPDILGLTDVVRFGESILVYWATFVAVIITLSLHFASPLNHQTQQLGYLAALDAISCLPAKPKYQ